MPTCPPSPGQGNMPDGTMDSCYDCDDDGDNVSESCCGYPPLDIADWYPRPDWSPPLSIEGEIFIDCSCAALENFNKSLWILGGHGAVSGIWSCASQTNKWYHGDAVMEAVVEGTNVSTDIRKVRDFHHIKVSCDVDGTVSFEGGSDGNKNFTAPPDSEIIAGQCELECNDNVS